MMKKYVSPEFLIALRNSGLRRSALRMIAKEIPGLEVFEACARREITSSEAAEILMLQREPNSWLGRLWLYYIRPIFEHFFGYR